MKMKTACLLLSGITKLFVHDIFRQKTRLGPKIDKAFWSLFLSCSITSCSGGTQCNWINQAPRLK